MSIKNGLEYVDCEFFVDRVQDQVVLTVVEDSMSSYHVLDPLEAAQLAAALFDKAEQTEDDQ